MICLTVFYSDKLPPPDVKDYDDFKAKAKTVQQESDMDEPAMVEPDMGEPNLPHEEGSRPTEPNYA